MVFRIVAEAQNAGVRNAADVAVRNAPEKLFAVVPSSKIQASMLSHVVPLLSTTEQTKFVELIAMHMYNTGNSCHSICN